MSMNFYLQSSNNDLKEHYPDVDLALAEVYENLGDYFEDMSDTEHVQSGHFFTHDKGWCLTDSTIPTINLSNSNMMYVLKDVLGIKDADYCGELECPNLAYLTCKVHERNNPNCYYGIPALKKLIALALNNGWSIYWS